MALKKIKLGDFAAGEIPPPIVHQYRDFSRQPISMVGWTILGFYVEGDGEVAGEVTWENNTEGVVRYTWHPNDTQVPGRYRGLIWVQNTVTDPDLRLASDQFEWGVVDGPGPTPPTTP